MIILHGYRTKSSISSTNMEALLLKLNEIIHKRWENEFINLLSDEVNTVADYYVLNQMTINAGYSILDVARDRVCERIANAMHKQVFTRYNMYITLEIMPHKGRYYILVVCNNPSLSADIFKGVKYLEPYHVYAGKEDTEENKTWEEIRKKYSGNILPLRQIYIPQLPINFDINLITYQSIKERASYIAISSERNAILSALSCDKPIPPNEIMRYIDEIDVESEISSIHSENIQERISQLISILPELNEEVITKKINVPNSAEQKAE